MEQRRCRSRHVFWDTLYFMAQLKKISLMFCRFPELLQWTTVSTIVLNWKLQLSTSQAYLTMKYNVIIPNVAK